MRNRGYRLQQDSKKKKWAESALKRWGIEITPRRIGRQAHTPAVCSCDMCGNVRRHVGNSKPMKMSEYRMSMKDGVE